MSFLTLVRHGQAAAFQKDSDLLTDIGREQARKLAEFWLRSGVHFDEVYTGTLLRQLQTEQVVSGAYQERASAWPMAQALPGFNEYDAPGILSRLVPALAERDRRVAVLNDAFQAAHDPEDRNRSFQRMFEIVMTAWARGEVPLEGVEPWPTFRARVRESLQRVMSGGSNRRLAVFTSGGPIGLSVQAAMLAPDRTFLEVNWRLRNCSLTEFVFSGDRFTLDAVNCVPHLEDRALWTYR